MSVNKKKKLLIPILVIIGIVSSLMIIGSNIEIINDYDSEGWFIPDTYNGKTYVDNYVNELLMACEINPDICDQEAITEFNKLRNHLNFDGSVNDYDGCTSLDHTINILDESVNLSLDNAGYDINDYDDMPDLEFYGFWAKITENRTEFNDYDGLYEFYKAHEELRIFANESWNASAHCWN